MTNLIKFEDIVEKEYQRNLRKYPLCFDILFDDVMISAINFIRKYQGDFHSNFETRLLFSINQALTISEDLLEKGALKRDSFKLYWGQNISREHDFRYNVIFEDSSALFNIHEYLEEQEFDAYYVTEIVLLNYIESFLDFFNEKYTFPVSYLPKREIRQRAMRNHETKLLNVLNQSQEHKDFELTFIGVKDQYNNTNTQFIKFDKDNSQENNQ